MKESVNNSIKKDQLIYMLIGLMVGIIITWSVSVYAVNGNHGSVMRTMGMHYNQDNQTYMSSNTIHDMGKCTSTQCSE